MDLMYLVFITFQMTNYKYFNESLERSIREKMGFAFWRLVKNGILILEPNKSVSLSEDFKYE